MSYFALNLVLAIVWMLLNAWFSVFGFAVGFLVGFAALVLARPVTGSAVYVHAVVGIVRLVAVFLGMLLVANVQLARDILRRRPPFEHAFLHIDARELGPVRTVLLGNLVSLTPGTITVDADPAGHALYVHTVYASRVEDTRRTCRRLVSLLRAAAGEEA